MSEMKHRRTYNSTAIERSPQTTTHDPLPRDQRPTAELRGTAGVTRPASHNAGAAANAPAC